MVNDQRKSRNGGRVALTIDIEDWYHVPAMTGSDFSAYSDLQEFFDRWQGRYDYITTPTDMLIEMLRELGLIATFFVVGDVASRYPGIVEKICAGGHEIACHGMEHRTWLNTRTRERSGSVQEFADTTGKARSLLRSLSGQDVIGYRAPNAYVGEWMFDVLARLGFKYDSSVNPNSFFVKADFPLHKVSSAPYWIDLASGDGRLLELPWPFFSLAGIRFPTAGGPYLRMLGSSYVTCGLKQSLQRGSTLFYFHSIDLGDERLPSISNTNRRRPMYWLCRGEATRRRALRVLKTFEGRWTTCMDIYGDYGKENATSQKVTAH